MRVWGRRQQQPTEDLSVIAPDEVAALERQVEEGVMIASAALRLSMKNRLIVRALRDGDAYDDEWMTEAVRSEIDDLVDEKTADADRLEGTRTRVKSLRGRPDDPADYRRMDVHSLAMRERITRDLTERLRSLSQDSAFTDEIISGARDAALGEVLGTRLKASFDPDGDPRYAKERRMRMNALKEDLWAGVVDQKWPTRA